MLYLACSDLADGSASVHLEALLNAAADAVQSERSETGSRPDVSLPLTLVGFSKGTVVLNQLVTELACEAAARGPPGSNRDRYSGDWTRLTRKRRRVSIAGRPGAGCDGGGHGASYGGGGTPPSSAANGRGYWNWALDGGDRHEGDRREGQAKQSEDPETAEEGPGSPQVRSMKSVRISAL